MQLIFNKKKAAYGSKRKKGKKRRQPCYPEDDTICSPKMLVTTYKITWCQNPEDHDGHVHCCENLKFWTTECIIH
jgi:hypothetical protein